MNREIRVELKPGFVIYVRSQRELDQARRELDEHLKELRRMANMVDKMRERGTE